jgi:hypothetical protein
MTDKSDKRAGMGMRKLLKAGAWAGTGVTLMCIGIPQHDWWIAAFGAFMVVAGVVAAIPDLR